MREGRHHRGHHQAQTSGEPAEGSEVGSPPSGVHCPASDQRSPPRRQPLPPGKGRCGPVVVQLFVHNWVSLPEFRSKRFSRADLRVPTCRGSCRGPRARRRAPSPRSCRIVLARFEVENNVQHRPLGAIGRLGEVVRVCRCCPRMRGGAAGPIRALASRSTAI